MGASGQRWRRCLVLVLALAGGVRAGSFRALRLQEGEAGAYLLPTGGPGPPARGRVPVVLVHGWGFGNELTYLGLTTALRERLLAGDPLRSRADFLFYDYDHMRSYHQLALEFARDLRELVERRGGAAAPGQRPVLVGVSAGGLLGHYAMNAWEAEGRLVGPSMGRARGRYVGVGEQVAGLITIASPLHGALGASLAYARGPEARRALGPEHWRTLEDSREELEFEEARGMIHTLGFDNLGPGGRGELIPGATLRAWGVPVNRALREINQEARWGRKLFVHMGTNRPLRTFRSPVLGARQQELLGHLLGDPDSDPIIPVYSGTLAHAPAQGRPRRRHLYPAMTHGATVVHRPMHERVLDQVADLVAGLTQAGWSGPEVRVAEARELPGFGGLLGMP